METKTLAPTAHKVVVPADFEYVDTNLATACNYDTYTVKAGEYEVTLTDVNGHPVREGQRPYYATARIDAIQTEAFYVNSLFGHSSAHTDKMHRERPVFVQVYYYQVEGKDSLPVLSTRKPESEGWGFNVNAEIVPA